jgi:phospholipase C
VILFAASFATAQTYNTPIRHVIVVVQENRTPDNLFQDPVLIANGADISSTGFYKDSNGQRVVFPLAPIPLDTCYSPQHSHQAWLQMYDNGAMDGANLIFTKRSECMAVAPLPPTLSLSYVRNALFDRVHRILGPYFQLAEQYGFADRMFQTNQGPSFPAHQFLFAGTSAPVPYNDPGGFYTWFAAENPDNTEETGCIAATGAIVQQIAPNGQESKGYNGGYPCYEHPTLTDVLDRASPPVSWRYYAHAGSRSPKGGHIWDAPDAINHICQPSGPGGTCEGPEWKSNVVLGSQQVLTDICNGILANVTWVIPDGNWSDHAANPGDDAGPSWVAALTNYIGNSNNNAGCTPENYWSDTVILVTWDDWGGWFDHVAPWAIGYANHTGGQYVYGFRVPLIVVSAYNRHTRGVQGFTGYISSFNYDFGSILNFIEYAFGQSGNSLARVGPVQYPYADAFAPDLLQGDPYSLSDFFDFSQSHPFQTITGAKYPPRYFINYKGLPEDPDDDGDDQ